MKRLLLVRHAQSENNAMLVRVADEVGDDWEAVQARTERERVSDPGLSDAGKQQADLLAEALSERLQDQDCLLVSSPPLGRPHFCGPGHGSRRRCYSRHA